MAYYFVYEAISETYNYDRFDDQKILWEAREVFLNTISWDKRVAPFRNWLEELLELHGVPECYFRTDYIYRLLTNSEEMFDIMGHIADFCKPVEKEEQEEEISPAGVMAM